MHWPTSAPIQGDTQFQIPLFAMSVSAGRPAPADDYVEERLDLARLLVERPESTFFVRVEGESLIDEFIQPGDYLVVDRALEARHNDIVIALVDNDFTVKVLHRKPCLKLVSRNSNHETLIDEPFTIWGVVLWVVHKTRK